MSNKIKNAEQINYKTNNIEVIDEKRIYSVYLKIIINSQCYYGNYIKSESSIQEYLPVKYSALALTFSMIKSKKTVRTD